jgi:hypothetical protein
MQRMPTPHGLCKRGHQHLFTRIPTPCTIKLAKEIPTLFSIWSATDTYSASMTPQVSSHLFSTTDTCDTRIPSPASFRQSVKQRHGALVKDTALCPMYTQWRKFEPWIDISFLFILPLFTLFHVSECWTTCFITTDYDFIHVLKIDLSHDNIIFDKYTCYVIVG